MTTHARRHLAQRLAARPVARRPAARRADAFERQAHDLSRRFMAGEHGLKVASAPASAVVPGLDAGIPLAPVLREALEAAFDADLQAIRVHADAHAAVAAHALGARALASGRHLIFGEGFYRPDSIVGRRLIAHEVAHALQQAGRATHGGRLRVVEVGGNAQPQCDSLPDFEVLKNVHAPPAGSASRTPYDGVVLSLAPLMKGAATQPLAAFVADILPKLKGLKWPHHAESLLYDSCKKQGLFDEAAQLIERDDFRGGNRINTVGFSNGLVEALERRNDGWAVYTRAISGVSWLKAYETAWVAALEEFAMGGNVTKYELLPRADAGRAGTIYDHLMDVYTQIQEYKSVGHNEWVYRGLNLMYDIDARRVNGCVDMHNAAQLKAGKEASWTFTDRRGRAKALVAWGATLPDQVREFPSIGKSADASAIATSLKPYLKKLSARASAVGSKALAVWENAVSIEQQLAPKEGDNAAVVRELELKREAAGRLGAQQGIPQLLARLLLDLNRSDPGADRSFDSVRFRERANPWLEPLADLSGKTIAGARLAAFRAGHTADALAWIALDAFVLRLRSHLSWAASESANAGSGPAISTPDEAQYQRIGVARWIRAVAAALGWKAAVDAADQILEAVQERESILAIVGFDNGELLVRDPMAAEDLVERARKDFGPHVVRGMEPFSLDTLMLLYRAAYYRDFTQQLRLITPAGDQAQQASLSTAVPYLAADAKKALNTPVPQRWHANSARYAPRKGDKRGFSEVLRAHPRFQEFLRAHAPPGFYNVVPLGPEQVFVWFIPPFDHVSPLLRESLVFQGMVAATFDAGLKADQRFKRQQELSLADWLQRLQRTLAEKMTDEGFVEKSWPGILQHLYQLASGEYASAVEEFRSAFTWAMRRDRQVIARRVAVTLNRHADDSQDRVARRDALQELRRFNGVNHALKDFDREMQMGLLLLEVAPEFERAMAHARDFDVVYPFLGYGELALERARLLPGYTVAQRRAWLPDKENTDDWITQRLASLQKTVDRLRAARDEVQKASGFMADKDKQHIVSYVKLSSPLPAFTPMFPRYGGFLGNAAPIGFQVVEVLRSFVFHPAYGDAPTAFDPNAPSGYASAQFLEPDGKTDLGADDTEPLLRVQLIKFVPSKVKGQPPLIQLARIEPLLLTRKHVQEFEDLYNAVTWAGFATSMEKIESGILAVLEFYLDLAELLPGVGPVIAAARIAAAITEFMTSADYEALLEVARGGLVEVVEGLLDAITGQLDADHLAVFLLFGDPRLDLLLAGSTRESGKTKAKSPGGATAGPGRFGALKKIVDAFRKLGLGVLKALRKLDRYVQHPMQDVRIFASTRPLVSFALQFAANHIFEIVATAQKILKVMQEIEAGGDKKTIGQLEADLKEQQKSLGLRLHRILKGLQEFKLPHTIINIAPAIAVVLGVAESYVVKKTGFVGKVINVALKNSGAYDIINQHFAQTMVDAGADPNIYWREKVIPQVETRFNETRDQLVARLNEVFSSPTLRDFFDPVPALEPMKVQTDSSLKFEETGEQYAMEPGEADLAPLPSNDRPLIPNPAAMPRPDGGEPMTPALRAQFEQQLGQDFRHVRLHDGAVGRGMTDAFGADALTSGSHVFIRPGKRDETLGHELVHVIQQTGARPLGRANDPTPAAAHPERGLDYRPEKEGEASEIAAALRSGLGGRIGGAPSRAGVQPAGVSWFTVARLMREVSNLEAVKKSANKTDEAAKLLAGKSLSKENQAAVDKVVAVLQKPTSAENKKLWKRFGPFEPAMKMVEDRLSQPPYSKFITDAAKAIALESLEPMDAKPGEARFLAASNFERHLEAYVLAKTGLVIAIQLNDHKVSVPGKDFEAVDLDNPVKELALIHIHLPLMDGRAPLWAAAINNTWDPATEVGEKATEAYRTQMRHALRQLLSDEGIKPGIWPLFGDKFRFSLIFKMQAEKFLKQQKGERPDPVPSWQDYVETAGGDKGGVGLRLSHYDVDVAQKRKGRESHHLTQYLVAEFFANASDAKAFDGTRNYPGVFGVGSTKSKPLGSAAVGKIADKDGPGSGEIDVDATKGKGRGALMPTISLAASTHQKGKLHVTPQADEEKGGTKKTQATALKNEFRGLLPSPVATGDKTEYDKYVNDKGRDVVAAQIYHAVQQTYAVVEHHMSTQLEKNMPELEFQYYSSLVEGTAQDIADATNPATETVAQKEFRRKLDAVPALAKAFNRDEMLKFGWKTK